MAPAVRRNGGLHCPACCSLKASAARYFHAYYGHALYVVIFQYLAQLFRVIHHVQLGAADDGGVTPDEAAVEIPICKGTAVSRHKEIDTVEGSRFYGQKLYLHREI